MITKKTFLITALLGTVFLIFFTFLSVNGLCTSKFFCDRLHDDSAMATFLIFLPFLIFSIITYKVKYLAYQSWSRFVCFWIPLSILIIVLTPKSNEGLFPIEKGSVSVLMSIIFSIISILIIFIKSYSLRANKK